MIKVTTNEKGDDKPGFPCLMITYDGDILLATDVTDGGIRGTIIHAPSGETSVGHHLEHWARKSFEPFTGKITLENE